MSYKFQRKPLAKRKYCLHHKIGKGSSVFIGQYCRIRTTGLDPVQSLIFFIRLAGQHLKGLLTGLGIVY
jgi:hypothetical protein